MSWSPAAARRPARRRPCRPSRAARRRAPRSATRCAAIPALSSSVSADVWRARAGLQPAALVHLCHHRVPRRRMRVRNNEGGSKCRHTDEKVRRKRSNICNNEGNKCRRKDEREHSPSARDLFREHARHIGKRSDNDTRRALLEEEKKMDEERRAIWLEEEKRMIALIEEEERYFQKRRKDDESRRKEQAENEERRRRKFWSEMKETNFMVHI